MMKRTILLAIAMLTIAACGTDTCNEKKIAELKSPDGHYIAVLFLRNCGATTPFMQHINLSSASSEQFSENNIGAIEEGQVFLTSAGYGEAGEAGIVAQREFSALAGELGLLVAGPHGQGGISTPANLCAPIVAPFSPPGHIRLAPPSGHFV